MATAGHSPRELVLCGSAADFLRVERHAGREMVLQIRGACVGRGVLFGLSAVILILSTLLLSHLRSKSYTKAADLPAISLLLLGTVLAAAAGRVLYQMALTKTNNDNEFVSMFLLLVPATTCLVSIPMSWWIPDLKVAFGPAFYLGLVLIAAPLFVFSRQSWLGERTNPRESAKAGATGNRCTG